MQQAALWARRRDAPTAAPHAQGSAAGRLATGLGRGADEWEGPAANTRCIGSFAFMASNQPPPCQPVKASSVAYDASA